MPHSCAHFTPSFNVFLSLLTLQQWSPIWFALWERLPILLSFRDAVHHTNADQTSPSANKHTVNSKQKPLFVSVFLSRSLTLDLRNVNLSLSKSSGPNDHNLAPLHSALYASCRSSIWLSPVLGAWKQRLTQWLSWWQRARQGCGNTVMIKLFWMVPQ